MALISGCDTALLYESLVNQYTQTGCEDWSHDTAGNLMSTDATATAGRDRGFDYDHRGRLVGVVSDPSTVDEVTFRFAYDALGRKIHSRRADASATVGERFIYDDNNVIEEYLDGTSGPSATYLYSDGLDERLQMVRGVSWWYFDDELGSSTALVHRTMGGALDIERYAYQDYGEPTYFWGGLPTTAPISGNPYLFAGTRWLSDAGLYDMRTRHFEAVSGRFVSRDSIGIWGDEENLGNGYTYVSNAPDTHVDLTGTSKTPRVKNCHEGASATIDTLLEVAEKQAKKKATASIVSRLSRHRVAWLIGGLAISTLAGSASASGANAACDAGEVIHLVDPVVTVIEGPGNAAQEQVRWADLTYAYIEGPFHITFGEGTFSIERAP